jgi:hypothetical protein
MLSALLTGVRRAFPFVEGAEADALATTHADALFRIVHKAPFSVAVQSLALLFQIITARSAVSDRFSRYLIASPCQAPPLWSFFHLLNLLAWSVCAFSLIVAYARPLPGSI